MAEEQEKQDINFDELNGADDIPEDDDGIKINDISEGNARKKEVLGVELPDDSVIERTKLKLKILRYKEGFSKFLEHYGDKLENKNLEGLSNEDLEFLLEEIRITVGTRNSSSMVSNVFMGLGGVAEHLAPRVGMDLHGLQYFMEKDQNIKDTLLELSLEYESFSYLPPMQRLMLQCGRLVMDVNNHNKALKLQKIFNDSEMKKEVIEEFNDL
jgi:hypothetical protein